MRNLIVVTITTCGLLAATAVAPAHAAPPGRSIQVDCDRGKTIGQALEKGESPLEIVVSGHCQENVRIDIDDVTLVGAAGAKITGVDPALAAIAIEGARGIAVTSLIVEGGTNSGIQVARGGVVRVTGVTSSLNARYGILVLDHSSATIVDSTFSDNRRDGIGVWAGSQATIGGMVTCDRNTRAGIIVSGSSLTSVGLNPSGLALHDNGVVGLYFQLAASGLVGMPIEVSGSSEGISVYDGSAVGVTGFTSRDNSWAGVSLWNNATFESWTGANGAPVVLENNLHGIWVEDDSSFFRLGPTSFVGNTDAAAYVENSNVVLRWATSDGDNGAGFIVRNGSAEISRSNLDDRLDLSFGTRIEGSANSGISRVDCDATVISQLDHPCGHVSASLASSVAEGSMAPARAVGARRRILEP